MQKLCRFPTTTLNSCSSSAAASISFGRLLGVHSIVTSSTQQTNNGSSSLFTHSSTSFKFNQQFAMLNSSVQSHSTRSSAKRSVGIVGMPNVGKSTLFNALTESTKAEAANFPFCTIEPNVGVCTVPDERLELLAARAKTKKTVPTYIEVIDIAGLIKGAAEGKGLGNKFLSHIRGVNCIAQMVRCFDDVNITHVENTVDPVRDVQIIESELMLSDLDVVERNMKRKDVANSKDKMDLLKKCHETLIEENSLYTVKWTAAEIALLKQFNFLTTKKILYICNVDEQTIIDGGNKHTQALIDHIKKRGNTVEPVIVCAQLEAEVAQCEPESRTELLNEYGLKHTGLERIIKSSYELLDLITYYTVGVQETRAWTVTRGSTAPESAGVIHTDFEKGFIKAETVNWKDYLDCDCDDAKAKRKNLIRQEGKEYITQDGDVYNFKVKA